MIVKTVIDISICFFGTFFNSLFVFKFTPKPFGINIATPWSAFKMQQISDVNALMFHFI